jgi:hypothetical protein
VFSGMLGVTLFGLALTPVFFATIDWLSETHLFRIPWVRRIGSIGIDVIALRPVRRTAVRVTQQVRDYLARSTAAREAKQSAAGRESKAATLVGTVEERPKAQRQ